MFSSSFCFPVSQVNTGITTEADFDLFKRFGMQSGRNVDKFDGFEDVKRSENGLYYLTKASNMFMSGKVTEHFDLGAILFLLLNLLTPKCYQMQSPAHTLTIRAILSQSHRRL